VSISDFQTYGELIYSLQERYPSIQRSTLVLAPIGRTLVKLEGQITFQNNCSTWRSKAYSQNR